MKIRKFCEMSPDEKNAVFSRAEIDISEIQGLAESVCKDIRANGDSAVFKYIEQFDKVKINSDNVKVTHSQFDAAFDRIDSKLRDSLLYAAGNIRSFHEKQMPEELWFAEMDDGILAGEKTTPISDVCIYVPRGKGSFPSVLLMLALPAVVAKVPQIVVFTPPNEQGEVDDAVLAAAKICGITEVYKIGGIQAVAAAAFGTETLPKCSKIIGPGNSYVSAAKRVVADKIDIGLPAGPSECIILADEYVDPYHAALDLMIEAEHGPDSASLLVTHSEEIAVQVEKHVESLLKKLGEKRRGFIQKSLNNYGGAIITNSLDESVEFVNEYAPEHMEILARNPMEILLKIKNAGEILLGEYTPVTLCNFLLGPNAILPTGGHAKTHSSVSVQDFLKRSSVGYVSKSGFEKVKDYAYQIAVAEGFDAHAEAVLNRK